MQSRYIYTHIFIGFGANNKIYKQKPRTFSVLPSLKNIDIPQYIYIYQKAL